MTLFWLLAGLILAFTLISLLRPLIFPAHKRPCLPTREQIELLQAQQILRARGELVEDDWQKLRQRMAEQWLEQVDAWMQQPRRALAGWPLAIVLAFALPLAGWQLYQRIGSPGILTVKTASNATSPADSPQALQKSLEERVQVNPEDLEAWVLLARLHHELKRFDQAEQAYLKAMKLAPEEPLILVELAENRLFASGQRTFDDQSRQWLRDALTMDPQNQKALWLLGLDASQHEQWELAKHYWETLMPQLPAGSEVYAAVLKQLKQVYQQLGEPVPDTLAKTTAPFALKLLVELDASLQSKLPDNPVLFVFARAADGPPMPVAARKLPLGAFPMELTLSDADSLMPQRKLSDLDQWIISARIASEGQARGQSGDLEAEAVTVGKDTAQPVILKINRIQ